MKALKLIDLNVYFVALFQTAIPSFYQKLGARIIENKFINSKNKKEPESNPWWDRYIMIYPASYAWPTGIIDLNGGGY